MLLLHWMAAAVLLLASRDAGVAQTAWITGHLAEEAVKLDRAGRESVAQTLVDLELEFGVDPLLLLAMMERESRYDPQARGFRGGLGLMQVQPIAARAAAARCGAVLEDEEAALLDPRTNLRLAAAYLADMKRRFGSWELALEAYNMGPSRLRFLLDSGRTPTFAYSTPVLARYEQLRIERARRATP